MSDADAACNALDAVKFVRDHKADSDRLALKLGVPTENILGLAAEESQWGRGRIAREYNNYFSLHAPAPLQQKSEPAKGDPKIKVAVFESFEKCGESFALRFGKSVQGKTDPKDFAKALIDCKFNTGDAKTGGRDDFADYLVNIIHMVKLRLACK